MNAVRGRDRTLRRFAGSITLVTVLGHTVLGFEQPYLAPVVGAATGMGTAFVLETVEAWAWRRPARYRGARGLRLAGFFLPSYVTGLTCAMLLYAGARPMPVVLAVMIGVGSTYVLRTRTPGAAGHRAGATPGMHYMNPPCLGVAVVLLLFPWVGVAPPYPFTEWLSGPSGALVPPVVLVLGSVANAVLIGRLPLLLGWVGGSVLQGLVPGGLADGSVAGVLLPMTGVAAVLYTNYMITDLGTTPARPRHQVVFGLATAAVYGLLVRFHIVPGLFLALLIVCAGRGAGLALLARVRPPTVPVPADARDLSEVPAGVQP
ncbi:enediyne biosynthesis protein UnbU [Streptosporangium sp. NPDC087985]|uniref:enediyne biosynthesis protein UnbU n=1 Tax=Streptosporangium sp. NPDC087985 TaxID=3366196 RepID=UPI003828CAF4